MGNPEHVEIVKRGKDAIAAWRNEHPNERLDLSAADLHDADLREADLREADLTDADLTQADLSGAYLNDAELSQADLSGANLRNAHLLEADLSEGKLFRAELSWAVLAGAGLSAADLRRASLIGSNLMHAILTKANLSGAELDGADVKGANLSAANLSEAVLGGTNVTEALLREANFEGAQLLSTTFDDVDLSEVKGLEEVEHVGPSTIGVDTLVKSKGRIPEEFLRGCGFTPWQVLMARLFDPALTAGEISDLQYKIFAERAKPIQLGGAFISYSAADAPFVDRLYDRLMEAGASVWLDRHDLVAGPLQKQIDRAIRETDVVVLVLSESSVESDWVEHELEVARKKEKEEKRDILCPVALDDAWKPKMNDVLWAPVKKKSVRDFSQWESDSFDPEFERLVKGIRIYYGPGAETAVGQRND